MSNVRFSITPAKAVRDMNLTDAVFRTLAVLGLYGDENGWCFPSTKTLAEVLGKSRQAVTKDLNTLKALGYLEIIPRHNPKTGAQQSNQYQIQFDYPATSEVAPPDTPKVAPPATPDVAHNAPIQRKVSSRKRDDRLDHPAMKTYRELVRRYVPIAWRDAVVGVDDHSLWEQVVKDWIGMGWNPTNVKGMLEAYRNGGIQARSNGKRNRFEENVRALQGLHEEFI